MPALRKSKKRSPGLKPPLIDFGMRKLASLFLIFLTVLTQTQICFAQEFSLSEEDRDFLEKIQRDSVQYFLTYTNPETGLTQDSSAGGSPASVAATGFGLAALAIATTHGWISYREAYERIGRTIDTLEKNLTGQNGFFYHFLDPKTGKRIWKSEVSSIDTALLMAGALLAATYFGGTDLERRIYRLYDRVQWDWMLNGSLLFSHGWKPEGGFLPYYWDIYSEHLILQALAIGSDTHPAPKEVWNTWERLEDTFNGKSVIYSYTGSLFTYQYSHAFIDFKNLSDDGIDYFENSKKAAAANREFAALHENEFTSYQNGLWGLSASLGPDGYKAYGAEPGLALHDGTIAIYSVLSSIVFSPEESISSIRKIRELEGGRLYGTYGFVDAFNLDRKWRAGEYLGVDQGITVLMLENYLYDGAVWKRFMKLEPIKRWVERAELAAD